MKQKNTKLAVFMSAAMAFNTLFAGTAVSAQDTLEYSYTSIPVNEYTVNEDAATAAAPAVTSEAYVLPELPEITYVTTSVVTTAAAKTTSLTTATSVSGTGNDINNVTVTAQASDAAVTGVSTVINLKRHETKTLHYPGFGRLDALAYSEDSSIVKVESYKFDKINDGTAFTDNTDITIRAVSSGTAQIIVECPERQDVYTVIVGEDAVTTAVTEKYEGTYVRTDLAVIVTREETRTAAADNVHIPEPGCDVIVNVTGIDKISDDHSGSIELKLPKGIRLTRINGCDGNVNPDSCVAFFSGGIKNLTLHIDKNVPDGAYPISYTIKQSKSVDVSAGESLYYTYFQYITRYIVSGGVIYVGNTETDPAVTVISQTPPTNVTTPTGVTSAINLNRNQKKTISYKGLERNVNGKGVHFEAMAYSTDKSVVRVYSYDFTDGENDTTDCDITIMGISEGTANIIVELGSGRTDIYSVTTGKKEEGTTAVTIPERAHSPNNVYRTKVVPASAESVVLSNGGRLADIKISGVENDIDKEYSGHFELDMPEGFTLEFVNKTDVNPNGSKGKKASHFRGTLNNIKIYADKSVPDGVYEIRFKDIRWTNSVDAASETSGTAGVVITYKKIYDIPAFTITLGEPSAVTTPASAAVTTTKAASTTYVEVTMSGVTGSRPAQSAAQTTFAVSTLGSGMTLPGMTTVIYTIPDIPFTTKTTSPCGSGDGIVTALSTRKTTLASKPVTTPAESTYPVSSVTAVSGIIELERNETYTISYPGLMGRFDGVNHYEALAYSLDKNIAIVERYDYSEPDENDANDCFITIKGISEGTTSIAVDLSGKVRDVYTVRVSGGSAVTTAVTASAPSGTTVSTEVHYYPRTEINGDPVTAENITVSQPGMVYMKIEGHNAADRPEGKLTIITPDPGIRLMSVNGSEEGVSSQPVKFDGELHELGFYVDETVRPGDYQIKYTLMMQKTIDVSAINMENAYIVYSKMYLVNGGTISVPDSYSAVSTTVSSGSSHPGVTTTTTAVITTIPRVITLSQNQIFEMNFTDLDEADCHYQHIDVLAFSKDKNIVKIKKYDFSLSEDKTKIDVRVTVMGVSEGTADIIVEFAGGGRKIYTVAVDSSSVTTTVSKPDPSASATGTTVITPLAHVALVTETRTASADNVYVPEAGYDVTVGINGVGKDDIYAGGIVSLSLPDGISLIKVNGSTVNVNPKAGTAPFIGELRDITLRIDKDCPAGAYQAGIGVKRSASYSADAENVYGTYIRYDAEYTVSGGNIYVGGNPADPAYSSPVQDPEYNVTTPTGVSSVIKLKAGDTKKISYKGLKKNMAGEKHFEAAAFTGYDGVAIVERYDFTDAPDGTVNCDITVKGVSAGFTYLLVEFPDGRTDKYSITVTGGSQATETTAPDKPAQVENVLYNTEHIKAGVYADTKTFGGRDPYITIDNTAHIFTDYGAEWINDECETYLELELPEGITIESINQGETKPNYGSGGTSARFTGGLERIDLKIDPKLPDGTYEIRFRELYQEKIVNVSAENMEGTFLHYYKIYDTPEFAITIGSSEPEVTTTAPSGGNNTTTTTTATTQVTNPVGPAPMAPGNEYEWGIAGDANSDGVLNIRDAAYIARMLAGGKMEYSKAADFNGDGAVNVRDAAAIAMYLARKSIS